DPAQLALRNLDIAIREEPRQNNRKRRRSSRFERDAHPERHLRTTRDGQIRTRRGDDGPINLLERGLSQQLVPEGTKRVGPVLLGPAGLEYRIGPRGHERHRASKWMAATIVLGAHLEPTEGRLTQCRVDRIPTLPRRIAR